MVLWRVKIKTVSKLYGQSLEKLMQSKKRQIFQSKIDFVFKINFPNDQLISHSIAQTINNVYQTRVHFW